MLMPQHISKYYWLTVNGPHSFDREHFDLFKYEVVIEAKPIAGVEKNLSDITYNPETNSLFGVVNKPPSVIEISLDGQLKRLIPIQGLSDVEGIEYIKHSHFVITDENEHSVYNIHIDGTTSEISLDSSQGFILGKIPKKNYGLEGVSWDEKRQILLVANEKYPANVTAISGFSNYKNSPERSNLSVETWLNSYSSSFFSTDISGIAFHQSSSTIWILSDESQLLLGLKQNGRAFRLLPFWRGYSGLSNSIPQPEGIAFGPANELYVVSEPNLFYKFVIR